MSLKTIKEKIAQAKKLMSTDPAKAKALLAEVTSETNKMMATQNGYVKKSQAKAKAKQAEGE